MIVAVCYIALDFGWSQHFAINALLCTHWFTVLSDGSNVILISQFSYEGGASGILYIQNEPHLISEEVDDPRIDEDTLVHVGYLVTNDEDSVGFDCLVRGPNTWQQIQALPPVFQET